MNIILWVASYFRYKTNNQTTKASLQNLLMDEGCLGDKEQKAVFLVAPRSDVHFGFDHLFLRARSGA